MSFIRLVSICFTVLAFYSVQIVSAQEPLTGPSQAQYAPTEVIVQFAPSFAPHQLSAQIQEEEVLRKTLSGKIKLFIQEHLRRLQMSTSAHDHLKHIETVTIKVGMQDMKQMFDVTGESQENTYLIALDGSVSVPDAIKALEALEEVMYAQPNYVYALQ